MKKIVENSGTETIGNLTRVRGANQVVLVGGEKAPKCTANVKTYGNIWTRHLKMNKGESKAGHKHEFDHLHFLASGSVEIRVYKTEDKSAPLLVKDFKAPTWIKVPKEHFHDIVALEDGTEGYCIQAIRNEDKEVVDSDYAYDTDWLEEVKAYETANNLADETKNV